ncbi:MAG TPA: hypothetical protein VMH47_08160 [Gaiellaceae bacterium]|nr:hypothetical protein [Gaiellaceae bacterium]
MTVGYDRLRELIRLQAELIGAGLFEEAIAVGGQWEAHASQLPAQAPEAARPHLEEALALAAQNAATLAAETAKLAKQLDHVGRGRRAIASYARA